MLVVHYPIGSKHLSLNPISSYSNETEFITYPGEQFIVRKVKKNSMLDGLELDYVGNIYIDEQQIKDKIDRHIDRDYIIFKQELEKVLENDQSVYLEDANYIIDDKSVSKINDDVFHLIRTSESSEDINDRLYTLYSVGLTNNMYILTRDQIRDINEELARHELLRTGAQNVVKKYVHKLSKIKSNKS
jgi:hypothetical protein